MKDNRSRLDYIVSLIFRLFLCLYVLLHLHIHTSSPKIIYIIGGVLAYIAYYSLKLFRDTKGIPYIIDVLVDILFAGVILYFYAKWNWDSFSFIFLLLLCRDLGTKYYVHSIIYVGIPSVMLILNHEFSYHSIVPFVYFYAFLGLDRIVFQIGQKQRELNGVIDDFFLASKGGKSYSIYKEAIALLNRHPFGIGISDIFCFRKSVGSIYLVNGTKFIWNYRFIATPQEIDTIFKKDIYNDVAIELDGKQMYKNTCFVHTDKENNISYMFVVFMETNFNELFINRFVLTQFFARMAKIVESEYAIKENEKSGLLEIKQKMGYVNMATNTMHFIRNKLSPLKDYIAMMEDFEKSNDEQRKKIKPHLDSEFAQVKRSFNMILERANQMLEKANNPFVFSQTEAYGPQQLFSDIKFIWQSYGLDESKIKVEVFEKIKGERKYIYYNKIGLAIVLDNWIANILNYNDGKYGILLKEFDGSFLLQFNNSSSKNGKGSEDFVTLYNENKKSEITKKQYHGLHVIRDYLDQMKISSMISRQDNVILFSLTFYKKTEIIEDEKSTDY